MALRSRPRVKFLPLILVVASSLVFSYFRNQALRAEIDQVERDTLLSISRSLDTDTKWPNVRDALFCVYLRPGRSKGDVENDLRLIGPLVVEQGRFETIGITFYHYDFSFSVPAAAAPWYGVRYDKDAILDYAYRPFYNGETRPDCGQSIGGAWQLNVVSF